MKNPIVSLYSVKYSYTTTEDDDADFEIFEREVFISAAGGWDAINDVVATFIAQLDGITIRPRVDQIVRLGATLVVGPDLLKELRDKLGGNPEMLDEFIQPLADLHLSPLWDRGVGSGKTKKPHPLAPDPIQ